MKDPNEFIEMVHDESGGEATTTPLAFEEVWKGKGWRRKEDTVTVHVAEDQAASQTVVAEDDPGIVRRVVPNPATADEEVDNG